MGIYLKYITNYLVRKASFWVIVAVYILVFSLICLIIPATVHAYFVWAWVTDFRTLNIILEYLIALFAAMTAVIIFRMPRDDGSELLICSKPIYHYKLITAKFIVFVTSCVCYGLVSGLFSSFGFCLPTNYWTVLSLMISMFTTSCIFSLLYGGIAILTSINHGKLWMITGNMIIVLITNIIFLVGATGLKDPAAAITDTKTTTSASVSFINRNNQQTNSNYIVSLNNNSFSLPDLDWEKQTYQEGVDKSTTKWIYPFDITGHMYIMSNLGYLNDVKKEINGNRQIGQSSAYSYKINDLVHKYPTESLPENFDDDNYELWTEFASLDSPLFYTQYKNIKRSDLKEFVELNTTFPPSQDVDKLMTRLMELFQNVITNENVICPSGISSDSRFDILSPISLDAPYINTRFLFNYEDPWSRTPTYTVGKFFNGASRTRNIVFKNPESVEPSSIEKDIFDYLIYEIMFDKGSDLYNCLSRDSKYWRWNLRVDPNTSFQLIYKEIYNVLSNDNVKTVLNLNSDYDYGYEIYKFKYYLSRQLLGYYGIENATCSNWIVDPTEKITVPYNYYFRLVFIPQYNSYTIRNIDQYQTSLPIQIEGMDFNPKEFLQYGTYVLPPIQQLGTTPTMNYLSYAFTGDNSGDSLLKSTCLYKGSIDVSELSNKEKELYQTYDLTNTGWVTVENQFGYFSELGLKIDTLLDRFAFTRSQIYNSEGFTNLYGSSIAKNSIQLMIYQHLLFTYTCDDAYNPYMLIGIYLVIDFIILSLGYAAYIRHDVK